MESPKKDECREGVDRLGNIQSERTVPKLGVNGRLWRHTELRFARFKKLEVRDRSTKTRCGHWALIGKPLVPNLTLELTHKGDRARLSAVWTSGKIGPAVATTLLLLGEAHRSAIERDQTKRGSSVTAAVAMAVVLYTTLFHAINKIRGEDSAAESESGE